MQISTAIEQKASKKHSVLTVYAYLLLQQTQGESKFTLFLNITEVSTFIYWPVMSSNPSKHKISRIIFERKKHSLFGWKSEAQSEGFIKLNSPLEISLSFTKAEKSHSMRPNISESRCHMEGIWLTSLDKKRFIVEISRKQITFASENCSTIALVNLELSLQTTDRRNLCLWKGITFCNELLKIR